MSRKNWNKVNPTSLQQAMELSIQHAREVHNRSVDHIADLMGLANKYAIYKWIENGSMPARNLRAFQHACGINLISRWDAHSGGYLLFKIPTGRTVKQTELAELHQQFIDSFGALARFYEGKEGAQETLGRVTEMLEGLAWHHGNVEQHAQPSLEFGEGK